MIWVKDKTGRFAQRPHYEPSELDLECESMMAEFLRGRHGKVCYPVSTDDLTVLIEKHVENLDLYADLSAEGTDVEGVTDFLLGKRPRVRISGNLVTRDWMANRLRTTLTHELGHVKFHTFMFDGAVMWLLTQHNQIPPDGGSFIVGNLSSFGSVSDHNDAGASRESSKANGFSAEPRPP